MKTIIALISLLTLALSATAAIETQPDDKDVLLADANRHANIETQPYDKDVPLADAIRQANELFPDSQPLTEQEVIAAVYDIKSSHPDIKSDTYNIYMRIVREKAFPKGMFFRQITNLNNENGQFQVDWLDLCLEGRVATAEEKEELLSKMPANVKMSGEFRVGGFGCRLRSRFIR